jgi:LEA14-like dessication related protein
MRWVSMKITIFRTLIIFVSVSTLLLVGCAGIGRQLDPPRISLAHIQPQEFTGLEAVLQIKLRVFNTNDVDLNVSGIEADLEINGRPFATGVSKVAVKIPSFENKLVPVTVYSSVVDIVKGIHRFQKAEQLKYRLTGKLRVAAGSMMPASLPFESEGEVSFNE